VVAPRHIRIDPTGRKPPPILKAPRAQVAIAAGARRENLALRLAKQTLETVAETRALSIITAAERAAPIIAAVIGIRIAKITLVVTETVHGDLVWRHQGIPILLYLSVPQAEIFSVTRIFFSAK
jgi:hypothetical protein